MIAVHPPYFPSECEQLLSFLSRFSAHPHAGCVLEDAKEICRLLHYYSFRTAHRPDELFSKLSSRYRKEILSIYPSASLPRRESSSSYLRLESLLPLLLRVALLRLIRSGAFPLSPTQLTLSDGMLLHLLKNETADG